MRLCFLKSHCLNGIWQWGTIHLTCSPCCCCCPFGVLYSIAHKHGGQIYAALGLPLFPLLTGSCSLMQAQSLQYFWHHPFYFFFLLFPQLNPGMTLSLLSFDSSSLLGPHPKLETDKHRPQFWYFCITAPQSPPWKLANVCSHVNRIFFWGKHGLVEGVQVFSIIRQTRDLSLLHLPWTHFPTFTES